MVTVSELAIQLGLLNRDDANRQKILLEKVGLPTKWPEINFEDVYNILQGDKKVKDGRIRFIIPRKIGQVEIRDDINSDAIRNCISSRIQEK